MKPVIVETARFLVWLFITTFSQIFFTHCSKTTWKQPHRQSVYRISRLKSQNYFNVNRTQFAFKKIKYIYTRFVSQDKPCMKTPENPILVLVRLPLCFPASNTPCFCIFRCKKNRIVNLLYTSEIVFSGISRQKMISQTDCVSICKLSFN